jgi:hypothetical protein
MAHQRGGRARRRCRRDGLFVDGVKVPTGTGGADILWRDGDRVRRVDPASFDRIMSDRSGPLEVLVVPHGAGALAAWFDEVPAGIRVWRGRLHPDSNRAVTRRRVRQVGLWDDRNLLACANFVRHHPDPSVPEQALLAQAALAAAESQQVAFTRRRANLEALIRAGERSTKVAADLEPLRLVLHGSPEAPLSPEVSRQQLRRRAGRLLNRSDAVAERLAGAVTLDRCGAALTVAAALARLSPRQLGVTAASLGAGVVTAAAVGSVSGQPAGLWAYRALATLSVFARANAAKLAAPGTAPGAGVAAATRQRHYDVSYELLSRAAPDVIVADAIRHGVDQFADAAGHRVVDRSLLAAQSAGAQLVSEVEWAARSTVDLVRAGKLRTLAGSLVGSVVAVSAHAQLSAQLAAGMPGFSGWQVEVVGAAAAATALTVASRRSEPGAVLARQARLARRTWSGYRPTAGSRDAERDVYDRLMGKMSDPSARGETVAEGPIAPAGANVAATPGGDDDERQHD